MYFLLAHCFGFPGSQLQFPVGNLPGPADQHPEAEPGAPSTPAAPESLPGPTLGLMGASCMGCILG